MSKTSVAALIDRVRVKFPKGVGKGLSAAQAAKIERELGVKLPASYREFLLKAGWMEAPEIEVLGLGPAALRHLDVIRTTKAERDFEFPLPRELVPIASDGRGGFWCLDTAKMKGGECPVVYRDHELIMDSKYRAEKDSSSFAAFLKREVDEAIPHARPPADLDKTIARFIAQQKKLKTFLDDQHPPAKATEADLVRAEKALGRPLPSGLRHVLASLDGASLGDTRFFSVRAMPTAPHSLARCARAFEKKARKHKTTHLLPIAIWPGNWLYCIDTTLADERVVCVLENGQLITEKAIPFGKWLAGGAKRGFF